MIGFVPKDYYVTNELSVDESIIIAGEIGAEGIGIIISEAAEYITEALSDLELKEGIKIGDCLSLTDIVNLVNKKFQPSLIHDATEGGIYGALAELLVGKEVGIELHEKPNIHPILSKLSKWLDFNPYRIISSGLLIFCISKSKAEGLLNFLSNYQIPCKEIGKVTAEKGIFRLDDRIIDKPKGDEIITALQNLERIKNERE
jgi:hydrogenase maturation factor